MEKIKLVTAYMAVESRTGFWLGTMEDDFTHHLEKRVNQLVITKQEFEEQIRIAFEAGVNFEADSYLNSEQTQPDKDTYINNLFE